MININKYTVAATGDKNIGLYIEEPLYHKSQHVKQSFILYC